jgi:AcrR family transcriptional regulator
MLSNPEQSKSRKTDRRIERTRTMLLEALMELIVENGYEAITVQNITDRANVARTTFYLHYRNKDDLLYNGLLNLYQKMLENTPEGKMDSPHDWEHLAKNAAFYKVMLGETGSQRFTVQLFNFLNEIMTRQIVSPLSKEAPPIPTDLTAAYLAGAQYGLWRWWLMNDMPLPIEEIAKFGEQLAVQGLPWALGQLDQTKP